MEDIIISGMRITFVMYVWQNICIRLRMLDIFCLLQYVMEELGVT